MKDFIKVMKALSDPINIKVMGPGCKKCHETDNVVREAVAEADSEATVEYITDIAEIAKHGIFSTPAVIVRWDSQMRGEGTLKGRG